MSRYVSAPQPVGSVETVTVGLGVGAIVFSLALYAAAGYGIYKFATRKKK